MGNDPVRKGNDNKINIEKNKEKSKRLNKKISKEINKEKVKK
ncbi:hypothetical protein [Methanosarcina spelaei]|jgi:hypothetical protein|nr:hypothetical protein [Methanosarcina spelaei]